MSPAQPAVPEPTGRFSRRQVLAWSALAAAVPFGAALRPAPAGAESADDAYARAFAELVANHPAVRRHLTAGREFLYRPRQLLVAPADTARVLAKLRSYGYVVNEGNGFGGVRRLVFAYETDIPGVVTRLRDPHQWYGQPVPLVQPHHVAVGFGNIMGNPGGPPRVATALAPPDPARVGEGAGVTVGICDTGIWRSAGGFHPQWLGGYYAPQTDDEDPLYTGADLLALQGGHGTFVAGVVRQAAPGVRFDPEQALDASGIGDEEMLVGAIGRLSAGTAVVNLSLGYFTQDDQPPLPMVNLLAGLPQQVAVVAAAGNAGTSRPSWPAALDRVVGVAALSPGSPGPVAAPYSSRGGWVDACAIGDRTSTYVPGQLVLAGQPTRVFSGFAAWAGTSFAAAHVSGRLAALMTATGVDADTARLALLAGTAWHPDFGVLVG
ncbi:S8/S53 family peptidase [Micromonospora echinofusca]|uniref:S8/S53 family peptidase n=1 Tax=Micromonospora echinofusca TaxID=47858 RepID=UPI0027DDBC3B|nr:S8/S53 family peptidase [Micromonospora echinofusca]